MNTKQTLKLIQSNGVVAVKADKTRDDDQGQSVDQLLVDLGHQSRSIPFLVIFPGNGKPPIAFNGLVTQGMISQALRDAGPSKIQGDGAGEAVSKSSADQGSYSGG